MATIRSKTTKKEARNMNDLELLYIALVAILSYFAGFCLGRASKEK